MILALVYISTWRRPRTIKGENSVPRFPRKKVQECKRTKVSRILEKVKIQGRKGRLKVVTSDWKTGLLVYIVSISIHDPLNRKNLNGILHSKYLL